MSTNIVTKDIDVFLDIYPMSNSEEVPVLSVWASGPQNYTPKLSQGCVRFKATISVDVPLKDEEHVIAGIHKGEKQD